MTRHTPAATTPDIARLRRDLASDLDDTTRSLTDAYLAVQGLYGSCHAWDDAHPDIDLTATSPSTLAGELVDLLGQARGVLAVLERVLGEQGVHDDDVS